MKLQNERSKPGMASLHFKLFLVLEHFFQVGLLLGDFLEDLVELVLLLVERFLELLELFLELAGYFVNNCLFRLVFFVDSFALFLQQVDVGLDLLVLIGRTGQRCCKIGLPERNRAYLFDQLFVLVSQITPSLLFLDLLGVVVSQLFGVAFQRLDIRLELVLGVVQPLS